MKILFTVCGRAGSKGIKGKNFKEFLGIPLLYYTLAAIELYKEKHTDKLVDLALNTDSPELAALAEKAKLGIVHIPRKVSLAGDFVAKIDVISDTWKEMEKRQGITYDIVVDCDITSPLRTVEDVERLIDKKASSDKWDIVYSVTTARRNPYFNMVTVDETGRSQTVIKSNFVARQEAPVIYDMNASLYAYAPRFLADGKPSNQAACSIIEMKDTAVLDLDNEGDFELMQVIAEYLFSKDSEMGRIMDKAKSYVADKK